MKLSLSPSPLAGTITAPPAKSYAHRYIIAAFLAGSDVRLHNAGDSKDVAATLGAMQALGLEAKEENGYRLLRRGMPPKENTTLYCNESGSTLRFLLPVASALGVHSTLTGEAGLLLRPIEGLVATLNEHGAAIDGLTVGGKLTAGVYKIDASISSQYISGLLFALPLLDGDSRIQLLGESVSKRYIDITLDVLQQFGIEIRPLADGYWVKGKQTYRAPADIWVEGDYSGAAFWLAAGALGAGITVRGLNRQSAQGDQAILDCLAKFGAEVQECREGVCVAKKALQSTTVDIDEIPDLAQILAVVAAYAQGETVLQNVGRLRYKESDRLQAIQSMLDNAKIACCLQGNDLHITGGVPYGAYFAGGNDHRTVMAAAILAAFAKGDSTITDAQAVDKSYPRFIHDYLSLGGKADVLV